jgi:peroxiredoxin
MRVEVITMPKQNKVLQVGDRAPDFSLRDAATGEVVSLDDLLVQPLMIFFGRGTW